VNITLRYTQDPAVVRGATNRLRRGVNLYFAALGGFLAGIGAANAVVGGRAPYTALALVLAAVVGAEPLVAVWLRVYRSGSTFRVEVEFSLTDGLIWRRTATSSLELGWTAIRKVVENYQCWILLLDRRQGITVPKAAMTGPQREEFTDFLAAQGLAGPRLAAARSVVGGRG
jgi:hypothetical protein